MAAPSAVPPAPATAPVDLMMLLNEASHALTTELAAGLAGIGITPREHCVLSKAARGDMTQREIAAQAGIDKTTMVVTVDQLERAGLAERRPAPTDRRARIVAITSDGREVLARADAAVAGIYDDVLGALPSPRAGRPGRRVAAPGRGRRSPVLARRGAGDPPAPGEESPDIDRLLQNHPLASLLFVHEQERRPVSTPPATATARPVLPSDDRARWRALAVLCAGMLMTILDQTIVNVALPSIQDDLGFSRSGLAWVVNAYMVAFGGLLLLAGRLGDLAGRRNVLVAGLVVFTAASLMCGLATGPGVLVAARFVQGAGGAMASAVILGMIVTLFPDPRERARAIGAFSFSAAAGGSIGNIAGGLITDALTWNWVFLVNVPIGVAVVLLTLRTIDADRGVGLRAGSDVGGAVLVTAGLMVGVYAIVGAADHGWASAQTLGLGALSVALVAGFVARQATARTPLLPLRLLRSRNLTGANAVQALMVAGAFTFLFLSALYTQRVLGYGASQVGLAILPTALVIGAVSLGLSAPLSARIGPRAMVLGGLALMAVGLGLLGRLPVDGGYVTDLLPAVVVLGAGFGLAMPGLTGLGMSGATAADSGVASGLFSTTQQIGGALGLAVMATLAASRTEARLAAGATEAAALTAGYRLAFSVAAGVVLAALALAAAVLRRADEPADDQPKQASAVAG